MNCSKVSILTLPGVSDSRGRLTFFSLSEGSGSFDVESVKLLTDNFECPEVTGVAHRVSSELVIALCGSVDVNVVDRDGRKMQYSLQSPDMGLYLPPMTWHEMKNLSEGVVLMILSSIADSSSDIITINDLR
jgi:dTDP-4-dehydrorhamnose 3,5-epimerase-like enzyme